jgi:uncharacterized protein (TIGR03663 family)
VSTGSTKSRGRKAAGWTRAGSKASAATTATEPSQADAPEISPRIWLIASLCVLAVAAFVRLYLLDLKPFHHDEGVNGFFLTNLYQKGVYHYDPANYHGPTLYFFALSITKLKALLFGEPGLGTIAVRLVPALFGIATVWLALQLRRHIGAVGALAAAALIALSPGHVYVSRYFIHEAHFVFFTLALVVAALRYWETADPVYLMLASISAALVFATKETAIITVAVLGLAWVIATVYMWLTRWLMKRRTTEEWLLAALFALSCFVLFAARRLFTIGERPIIFFGMLLITTFFAAAVNLRPGKEQSLWLYLLESLPVALVAVTLFNIFNELFYSSFFTYWQGVDGAFESLKIWARTGTKEHGHPWHTYLWWLAEEESPLLLLGALGTTLAVVLRRNRFAIFAGAWAFGILAAYSLIPYKTPWLMLNFTVPLAVIAGYGVNEIYARGRSGLARVPAIVIASAALIVCGTQAVILNFYRYDDDKYPYVYAHTYREFISMVTEIELLAGRAGTGKGTGITITAPEYWPLPWYLREYERAGFYGHMAATQEPIVVGSTEQEQELATTLGDAYIRIDSYPLRPGVTLVLYARRDLAGK